MHTHSLAHLHKMPSKKSKGSFTLCLGFGSMYDLFTVLLNIYSKTFFFFKKCDCFFFYGRCVQCERLPVWQTLCALRVLKTLVSIIKNCSERPVGFFFLCLLNTTHDVNYYYVLFLINKTEVFLIRFIDRISNRLLDY